MILRHLLYAFVFIGLTSTVTVAQEHSIAREWNEELLHAIRNDFARPTVHARNLWHSSVMMYDIWAIITDEVADTYFLGKDVRGFFCPIDELPVYTQGKEEAIRTAISYAMYRFLNHRFQNAPPGRIATIISAINQKMLELGYSTSYTSQDYSNGNPAALGNYVADQIIQFGLQDGSNELGLYGNTSYRPVNNSLELFIPEDFVPMNDPNRWQPLTLDTFTDQSGNVQSFNTPPFLSPEWGAVTPFALKDSDNTVYTRRNFDYNVFHDPGAPPYVNLNEKDEMSEEFLWGFLLVSIWSSHLDPADGVMIDISPNSQGNNPNLPSYIAEYRNFYNLIEGGDNSPGHAINPHTNQPYDINMVYRGDYTRVLAEFWADGPDSETPPGHWFTLLNYVSDHPEFERKYRGIQPVEDPLEWDVKSYFIMGGAMHDCAISAWGIKGWYDYLRPVSAIRAMANRGQSTIESLPNYHPAGVPLISGFSEIVTAGDTIAGDMGENIGKIKLFTWKGPGYIEDPKTDIAEVGWILAEEWFPYQRPTFVTPPFAGYISGHSTYSRAAAEVLTDMTGDAYFPGGLGEFVAEKNEFLVFEEGPSEDVVLQWATYRDASDQTSLSRIWGGIHPPADDIPGRKIGIKIAEDVMTLSESIFFVDADGDGFYNYEDCDDNNEMINPSIPETCDGIDNNCAGGIDEGLQLFRYFLDNDGDGYGNQAVPVDTCRSMPITGYVENDLDCNDNDPTINPDAFEICDGIDNNCSGGIDEDLTLYTYYRDVDGDGFGDLNFPVDTCREMPIAGYVIDNNDCNDADGIINPDIPETCDGIDNDCNGRADDGLPVTRYYRDFDNDGFGLEDDFIDTCLTVSPLGFVDNPMDCNDNDPDINPSIIEIADNNIDEDCTGVDLYEISKVFPNPFRNSLSLHYNSSEPIRLRMYDFRGRLAMNEVRILEANNYSLDVSQLAEGFYFLQLVNDQYEELYIEKVLKL